MKSNAKKSTTTSRTATQAANQPFFAKAGGGNFFEPVNRAAVPSVQMKMAVNKPGDKFEQEADKMAGKVMRMPTPAASEPEEKVQRQEEEKLQKQDDKEIQKAELPEEQVQKQEKEEIQKAEQPEEQVQKQEDEEVQRAEADKEEVQRKGNGAPAVNTGTQAAIRSKTTGGQPLSGDVRSFMEPRFNADFSNVRVHNDAESAGLSNQLSARAFTHQNHIFFSRDQYQPGTSEGKQLLAHELTHTIQQGHSVQRSPQVSTTSTPPTVQRLGVQDALDYFADKANNIIGFRMLTVLLGFNPINKRSVDRNAANLLRALIELIPGGAVITQALDNHGVINKAATWVEQKITTLGDIGSGIIASLKSFINSLSLLDIRNLDGVWERAKSIFTKPISRLINFGISVGGELLKMVKDAILKPLAALAKGTKGYDLLCALLGEDPITSKPVPRNAETLIGGFMKLIGREELWKNLKKANAVPRAWAWFQKTWVGLLAFAHSIPGRITATLDALNAQDILTIAGAFKKVVGTFANIAGEFISWGGKQVVSLLEILFSVVAPSVMPYLKKAKGAFVTILKNPIGFAGNLVRAGKLGFQMFAGNILKHLKNALIKWIIGPLGKAGVYIPKSFSLMEIIKLVLSVLGLTWQNIRQKLVKIIPDPILTGLEKTAGILVTLVKDGPVAAWEQIKTELAELKDQLISQVTEMVTTKVVQAAVTKLGTMLNPAGAVIQAIISVYNTISFFIERAGQMASVVGSFINSISAIAAGRVKNAATRVEQTMAKTLNVVLAFLANFAGLDNIPRKIVDIIQKIRKPIDKGLDKIVGWLGKMLKKLVKKGKGALAGWLKIKKYFTDSSGKKHSLSFRGNSVNAQLIVKSTPKTLPDLLDELKKTNKDSEEKKKKIKNVEELYKKILTHQDNLKKKPDENKKRKISKDINVLFGKISAILPEIIGNHKKYKIGVHRVTGPDGATDGESHHVPVKMLKTVIAKLLGDVLPDLQTEPFREHVKGVKKEAEDNSTGDGLAAIWLSRDLHDKAHSVTNLVPENELSAVTGAAAKRRERSRILEEEATKGSENSDVIIPKTKAGILTTSPRTKTITTQVKNNYLKKMERSEDKKYLKNVESILERLFRGMLNTGIAALSRVDTLKKFNSWKDPLLSLAEATWRKYLRLRR